MSLRTTFVLVVATAALAGGALATVQTLGLTGVASNPPAQPLAPQVRADVPRVIDMAPDRLPAAAPALAPLRAGPDAPAAIRSTMQVPGFAAAPPPRRPLAAPSRNGGPVATAAVTADDWLAEDPIEGPSLSFLPTGPAGSEPLIARDPWRVGVYR
ncbi:hypothetical protein [Jannaschia sp. LMIT008]|uniref:hypothetical protein n=1 Tax=Jannaschia maritima TaxID=3032585 RepID=UPI0028128199|nr:hypothetical protein [Jannaschia sp. LMIT008]